MAAVESRAIREREASPGAMRELWAILLTPRPTDLRLLIREARWFEIRTWLRSQLAA
jgi:hypothetical protein